VDQDDYLDIQPWPVAELAGQLIAHVALGRRGLIEADIDADVFERETDRFELDAWSQLELTAWLDASGTSILSAPSGTLSDEQIDRCNDALVVGSTIAWSMYIVEAPTLSLSTDGSVEQRVLDWAPGPWTPVRNVVKGLRTRTDVALASERERWELIHWRCSIFDDPGSEQEDRSALTETIRELADHPIVSVGEHDFLMDDGREFGDLDPVDLGELFHVSELRLRTMNWVCGFGDSPSTAPLFDVD
jgi:hypothetical protein